MAEPRGGRPISGIAAAHRRRQGDRGQEAIFPAQESVPVLRREDRRYQLQGRAAAEVVHHRARQDHAAAHFRRVRAASAAAGGSHQAGAQHRADAVLDVRFREELNHGSHSKRRYRKLGTRGQVVKVAPGYARNFLLPRRLAVAATESNKKIVEQERQAHLRREAKEIATRRNWRS